MSDSDDYEIGEAREMAEDRHADEVKALRDQLAIANEELERRRRLDEAEANVIRKGKALMEEAHKRLADEVELRSRAEGQLRRIRDILNETPGP